MGADKLSDKFMCVLAALIALCYITYIVGFIAIGEKPADGIVFSAVIGALALMGGVKLSPLPPDNDSLPPV